MRALGTTRIRVVRVAAGGGIEQLTITQHRLRYRLRHYTAYSIDDADGLTADVVYFVAEDVAPNPTLNAGTLV